MVRKVYHEQSFLEERPPDGGLRLLTKPWPFGWGFDLIRDKQTNHGCGDMLKDPGPQQYEIE
ncbi:hypothetical protein O1O06_18385, partial [Grimontia hollisae]|uniref:hypothetical protein n=1 Tax=Grimontia hollisae TaxID=673 RepID=UPI0023DCD620